MTKTTKKSYQFLPVQRCRAEITQSATPAILEIRDKRVYPFIAECKILFSTPDNQNKFIYLEKYDPRLERAYTWVDSKMIRTDFHLVQWFRIPVGCYTWWKWGPKYYRCKVIRIFSKSKRYMVEFPRKDTTKDARRILVKEEDLYFSCPKVKQIR